MIRSLDSHIVNDKVTSIKCTGTHFKYVRRIMELLTVWAWSGWHILFSIIIKLGKRYFRDPETN